MDSELSYSYRKAFIGSILAARRAGMVQASNVIPFNLALWDKEAMLDLNLLEDPASHSLVFSSGESAKSVKIRARPLDKVLEELGIAALNWVKIDVQGAEVEVIRGMEKAISRSPNLRLLVELHSVTDIMRIES